MRIQELRDNPYIANQGFDYSEEDHIISVYGNNYIGRGYVCCQYCSENAVPYQGQGITYVCQECREDLKNLKNPYAFIKD